MRNGVSGLLCSTVAEMAAALDKTDTAMGHAAQTRVNEQFSVAEQRRAGADPAAPKREPPMDNDNLLVQKAADLYRGLRL